MSTRPGAVGAAAWTDPAHVEDQWKRGQCIVLGILNVTPDSFSDGGRFSDLERAVEHGRQMIRDGADLVDVGGESTRPGALRVSEAEELRRVLPVVQTLASEGISVSIDTTRAGVAEEALTAGAAWVNDVSGGVADRDMASVVRAARVPYVAMHWRGHSDTMTTRARYTDVAEEVRSELARRIEALVLDGVDESQIIVDPGLGFSKCANHDWALLRGMDRLQSLGRPVLIGASRKSFLRLAATTGHIPEPASRDALTIATTALAVASGVAAIRVHDVRGNRDAATAARYGAPRGWAEGRPVNT